MLPTLSPSCLQLPDPAVVSELEQKLEEQRGEARQLKERLSAAEEELGASNARLSRAQMDAKSLQDSQQVQEEANARLKEKLSRLEVGHIPLMAPRRQETYLGVTGCLGGSPQAQLQTNAAESSEAELALHAEVRGLRSELDEAKRKASRLSQEHRECNQRVEEAEKDKETLRQTIGQLEDTKRQQERALEKLNKEVRRREMWGGGGGGRSFASWSIRPLIRRFISPR